EFIDAFGDRILPVCVACAACLAALGIDCTILCRNGTWDENGEGFLSCMSKCASASPLYNMVCGGICTICGISGPKPCPPRPPPPPPIPPRKLPPPNYQPSK